jgi:hypothetical protein
MSALSSAGPILSLDNETKNAQFFTTIPNGSPFPYHQRQFYPHQQMPNVPSPSTTTSLNRSQRCGVCRGCQNKACGQCTFCMDSPQFGGPGVKKQSCIERRCHRVLENRLQRDAPTFKARIGCNNCEDCRMADCQGCLVCLDKKFFGNRYMPNAMCAKKRCNNATNLTELDRTVGCSIRERVKWMHFSQRSDLTTGETTIMQLKGVEWRWLQSLLEFFHHQPC